MSKVVVGNTLKQSSSVGRIHNLFWGLIITWPTVWLQRPVLWPWKSEAWFKWHFFYNLLFKYGRFKSELYKLYSYKIYIIFILRPCIREPYKWDALQWEREGERCSVCASFFLSLSLSLSLSLCQFSSISVSHRSRSSTTFALHGTKWRTGQRRSRLKSVATFRELWIVADRVPRGNTSRSASSHCNVSLYWIWWFVFVMLSESDWAWFPLPNVGF